MLYIDPDNRLALERHLHRNYFVSDCKQSEKGSEFRGTLSTTTSGKDCQNWFTQMPHPHNYTNIQSFPDHIQTEVDFTDMYFCYNFLS